MSERLTTQDVSFCSGYGNHAQRYDFAAAYCRDAVVVDAGCGIGYGSAALRKSGARHVIGIDLSEQAIDEASSVFGDEGIDFVLGDVQRLPEVLAPLQVDVQTIVSFENIEHIPAPERFLSGAAAVLSSDGVLVISTPNTLTTPKAADGRPANEYHLHEFGLGEFETLLRSHFSDVTMFGQWQTPAGRLRIQRDLELHRVLCELYFAPPNRIWRGVRRMMSKPIQHPPEFSAMGDAYLGDYELAPLDAAPYPWHAAVFLAVCRGPQKS